MSNEPTTAPPLEAQGLEDPQATRALATVQQAPPPQVRLQFTSKEAAVIKQSILPEANEQQLQLFIRACMHLGLNPLTKQIYGWIDKRQGLVIHIGIDGLRVIANRTGLYAGQEGPLWCGADGKWMDVWLESGPPAAAKVGIRRRGSSETNWTTVTWKEFARPNLDTWKDRPSWMIAKVAEYHGLKRVFGNDMQELADYNIRLATDEEIQEEQAALAAGRELLPPENTTEARQTPDEPDDDPGGAEFRELPPPETQPEDGEKFEPAPEWLERQVGEMREALGAAGKDWRAFCEGHGIEVSITAVEEWLRNNVDKLPGGSAGPYVLNYFEV